MSLTLGGGPLSQRPAGDRNYELKAPEHRMFFQPYPRRMRAMAADRIVLDSTRGRLLHETGTLPVYWAPLEDFDGELLERTETVTECPYRGVASYWSVHAGGHTLPDAVWAYENPKPGHEWIRGYAALEFDAPDAWFCEDERLFGHLRDPFHRVDVFESSRPVAVHAGEREIARSQRPKLLFETGLPTRLYIPAADVSPGVLWPSPTRTICPYKGEAWHWTLDVDGRRIEDVAWSYESPLPEAFPVRGHLAFYDSKAHVELGQAPGRFQVG